MERKRPDPIVFFLIAAALILGGSWISSLNEPKAVNSVEKDNGVSIEKPKAIETAPRKVQSPKKKKSDCSFIDPSSLCGPLNPANPLNPLSDPWGLWD